MKTVEKTILQIIPCATPLYANYTEPNGKDTHQSVIVCLALVEYKINEEVYRLVVGMDACEKEIELVDEVSNFLEYTGIPQSEEARCRADRASTLAAVERKLKSIPTTADGTMCSVADVRQALRTMTQESTSAA